MSRLTAISRALALPFLLCTSAPALCQQLPPVFEDDVQVAHRSPLVTIYLNAKRIVWMSDTTGTYVVHPEILLQREDGQVVVTYPKQLRLKSDNSHRAGILLDFGREIHGGLRISMGTRPDKNPVRLRLRFGESAMEAMATVGGEGNATNEHSLRDFVAEVPWLGSVEVGETGFRFVRIDLVDEDIDMPLYNVQAAFVHRDLDYLGSFESSDDRLNDIWMTGAYTVHLNMQDYLWDGIKRDRLVWVGDLHPEVLTVCSVFGQHDIVPRTLDFARDQHPLPLWMNGISSYSMWWILIHKTWYDHYGDLPYLREQERYLTGLLDHLSTFVDERGKETLDGERFLDWPTSPYPEAVHAGLQAMMVMTFEAGGELMGHLGRPARQADYAAVAARLREYVPPAGDTKQAAAMMVLAGLADASETNRSVLKKDGVQRMSTFYGYYILEAMAAAGDYTGALKVIRDYWGAMLDLGATTFWEDFDINDSRNATPIDRLVGMGKDDIHGDFGDFCYVGYRHSFAHSWASGPTTWLREHVLGITLGNGGDTAFIDPHLGDLTFVRGSFPTKFGVLEVSHKREENGTVSTEFDAPDGLSVKLRGDY